ncbi:MAG TPA: hypothetical protein VGP07_22550 [Polyangia bacterium]|jgi:hypothetical protein
MNSSRLAGRALTVTFAAALMAVTACGGGSSAGGGAGHGGGAGGAAGGGGMGGGAVLVTQPVVVSTATRQPRVMTLGVNYWMWSPTYGNQLPGSETAIAALTPAIMRVGGYNNDANTPDPFDDAQMDAAVAYARAIGAEPLIQVPRIADTAGKVPTADTAAAMVRYANVTKGYGIKYFSIGNEPDLYDSAGAVADSTKPAYPGYLPADYCTSARAYATAMKAVDPTIQIVGPDLSYKYQGNTDWLTPILMGCGDLLDVVAIHRYPFSAVQATREAAAVDAAAFRRTVTSVRTLMTAAGYPDKPLAITEMNVAYDATTCVLDASPSTVGGGLWMADILGQALELNLWTNAVWDISDAAPYAFGLLDVGPAHVPRPAYYAYAFYAQHFGTTLLNAPTTPGGVSAYASRNQADTATQVIVINWNTSTVKLAFQVTDLAVAPAIATYQLPAVSMAAVEIPDVGATQAWSYGEAQRQTASAPQLLTPDVAPPAAGAGGTSGGAGAVPGAGCGPPSTVVCPKVILPAPTITTNGLMATTGLTFGSGATAWGSYAYAATGQTAPIGTVTADGNGIHITGGFTAPVDPNGNYTGFGLYFDSASCINAVSYTGMKFDFAGSLGGCGLALGSTFSGDSTETGNPGRGACTGTSSTCYGPAASVVPVTGTTIMVPFSSFAGGMPVSMLDPTTLMTVQWQLTDSTDPAGNGSCAADFTVSNVAFY